MALHDEKGKATTEPLPRLLIDGGRSMNLWFMYEEKARERGMKLIDYMSDQETKGTKDKIDYFLNQIVSQIIGMSRLDSSYRRRAEQGKKILMAQADRLGISY